MSKTSHTQYISKDEIDTMYEKCLFYLSHKGVKINHPEVLKILDRAGAWVDFDSQMVRFPEELIETAMKNAPESITIGDNLVPHPEGSFYMQAMAGPNMYSDPESRRIRDASLSDVREVVRLQELLNEVSIVAYANPQDVPAKTMDVHAMKTLFENSSKNAVILPNTMEGIEYIFELIRVITDHDESLRKRSSIVIAQSLLSPFEYKPFDAEVLLQACRNRQPIQVATCAMAGATAPFTIAGHVLLSAIEILSQLVLCQLIEPGMPVMANPMLLRLDLYKGLCFAGIELFLTDAAVVQFMKETFRIPTATSVFMTNSVIPDQQCGLEKVFNGQLIMNSGCDILIGAGCMNGALILNPLQIIIDDALTAMLRRIASGIEVNDETLAWQHILDIGPGGEFLGLRHTLRHADDDIGLKFFRNYEHELHKISEIRDLNARALEIYHELKKEMKPLQIPEDVQREMDRIVKKADEHVV